MTVLDKRIAALEAQHADARAKQPWDLSPEESKELLDKLEAKIAKFRPGGECDRERERLATLPPEEQLRLLREKRAKELERRAAGEVDRFAVLDDRMFAFAEKGLLKAIEDSGQGVDTEGRSVALEGAKR